ncbi:energy transducer TonB [Telmatobacter sp. DSM 110680]|uniref:Energy transducer TonB n=1 Tax=Telmatobacter sp. DSM 110680 TaxID=3036704 RepID=A0AAU7DPF5_9BACT
MRTFFDRVRSTIFKPSRIASTVLGLILMAGAVYGQAPPPVPSAGPATQQPPQAQQGQPVAQPGEPSTTVPAHDVSLSKATMPDSHTKPGKDPTLSEGAFSIHTVGGEIKEDQLKQMLVGKTLYLRGGYQDNNLEFDEHGRLLSHSPQGSYTLSQIQINKVKLSKKKVELLGDRYALHFLGAAPYDDPTAATDRVKINPKKKGVRISFDLEEVEKSKDKSAKKKDKHHGKKEESKEPHAPAVLVSDATDTPAAQANASDLPPINGHQSNKSDKKRSTTNSAVQASQALLTALNNVFSMGVDERMIDAMPDFWKLYYQAAQAKTDYKPTDPGVFRQNAVDQKAKLLSAVDPPSNELAQANGVAGIALYHVVVGSDGKVEEVVAGRPIGFGLDESAEQTIHKATFQPGMKDGKPVPVALDLVVSFRIYSKRTLQPAPVAKVETEKANETILPGPYTVRAQAEAQAQTPTQSQTQTQSQSQPQPVQPSAPAPQ